MTEVERRGSGGFATLAPFCDGNIFSAKFAGDGAWERHSNGDELVQIVGDSATLHTITDDGPTSYPVNAGMMITVPRGTWHRFQSPDGVGARWSRTSRSGGRSAVPRACSRSCRPDDG